jgi:hypothetical protein
MNDFVQQCLREWRRIGVPDAIANEMAADLDADLRDAAAEGVAPEEVLGNGIFDAPSFARSWAHARGVIPPARVPAVRHDVRRAVAVALAGLAVLGVGLLAVVVVHPTARALAVRRSAFVGPGGRTRVFPPPALLVQHPGGVGAPAGVLFFGVLVIALLTGSALLLWRRA